MTPENFCYWLQGYFEISGKNELTEDQIAVIQIHLGYVFNRYGQVPQYPISTIRSGYSGYVGKSGYYGYIAPAGSGYSGYC